MVQHISLSEKAQTRLSQAFSALRIGTFLRQAGITKSLGFSCLAVFQTIFLLVFQQRNWFRLLQSEQGSSLPGKDVIYRFLNHPQYAWGRFLHGLSLRPEPLMVQGVPVFKITRYLKICFRLYVVMNQSTDLN
ncbi:hypothetical protein AN963_10075 [Brevibacillus choshinensis]|uniref:Uncharacterized protein n=1 Tax=Brevibacillus choshinensis TaxID=54911 RepID=A0ABR5NEJ9_BRECH|nr:hypothetical protein AN963_10075 [Brevibacillus choshinensis]